MKFLGNMRPDFHRVPGALVFALATTLFGGSDPLLLQSDPLLKQLEKSLQSNFTQLQSLDSNVYFLGYRVHDTLSVRFTANKGGVLFKGQSHSRTADVELRLGNREIDNSHKSVDNFAVDYPYGVRNLNLPLDTTGPALSHILRVGAETAYQAAKQKYSSILTNIQLRPNETRRGLDFAPQKPFRKIEEFSDTSLCSEKDLEPGFKALQAASRIFGENPMILSSNIDFDYTRMHKRLVHSEGTRAAHTQSLSRLGIYGETLAEDGMVLWLDHNRYQGRCEIPASADSLEFLVRHLVNRLDTLRRAPILEPYIGPVILQGAAAGVFVHEVFGHRVEGHRQKQREEGQTFLSKIGRSVTRKFINIYDNPMLEDFKGEALNGYYPWDAEGVPPSKTWLIEKGVFKGFLLSRNVLEPTQTSNGHGRGNLGREVTSRMGVTVLESLRPTPEGELRKKLIEMLKEKKLPFGLVIEDISGGYTLTDRDSPQTFKLEPLYIRKVFADGRPDQVVRGVDAVGTPLGSLNSIVATGDRPVVFNGFCGAESGWVPVSTIAPSLLLSSLEFELKNGVQEESPYLAPPALRRSR